VVLVGLWFYFSRLEIRVSRDVLTYRTMFRRQSIALADVAESTVKGGAAGAGPGLLLVVTAVEASKSMEINLKPFRLNEVAHLLELAGLKVDDADDVA
jgi:hypothetical protein